MLNELFHYARKYGAAKLEGDVEDPKKSAVFSKYPRFIGNHHALYFVCDTLRMYITGGVGSFELDQMMELDMEVHHQDANAPVAALTTVADSLPGLGIVAAVLGVVITMGALGGPPEEIGHKVAAALVGTFLGILLCYGLFGQWPPTWAKPTRPKRSFIIACVSRWRLSFAAPLLFCRSSLPAAPSLPKCGPPSRKWKAFCKSRGRRGGCPAGGKGQIADLCPNQRAPHPHHHHQEEAGSRRPSRRRMESGLRRFRHRDDGPVHRALAAQIQPESPEGRGRLLSGIRPESANRWAANLAGVGESVTLTRTTWPSSRRSWSRP